MMNLKSVENFLNNVLYSITRFRVKDGLVTRVSGIKFCQGGGWNSLQHFLGEDSEELPSNIK